MEIVNSFSDLLAMHTRLDGLFAEHQVALLHFDFDEAVAKLAQYELQLLAHMADEEEVLIPLYAERAEMPKGGAPKLFIDEHEKMRAHITLFAEATEALKTEERPEVKLLMLLDREAFYKRLNSHHDIREREILYPLLDSVTDEAERRMIIARCSAV